MIKFLFVSYLLTTLIKQVIIFVEWWETQYWFLVHITSNCKEGKDEVALKATLPAMIIEVIMILEFITKIVFFSFPLFFNLSIWKRKKIYHLFDCSKKYQILKKHYSKAFLIGSKKKICVVKYSHLFFYIKSKSEV